MGYRLFDREAVLNVGGLLISSRDDEDLAQPILRMQFRVVKSNKREPNTADITIYNLNKDNRTQLQEKNIPTILEAGYKSKVSQIFSGVLQFGSSVQNGVDWVTTVQSGDGGSKYKSARINTNLKGPVNITNVLKTVGESLGLKLGNLSEKVSQGSLRTTLQEISEGIVLSGKSEKIFTNILKQMGYSWSIQDEQLQILGPNEVIGSDAQVLSAVDGQTTGLIGSPESGEKGIVKARALLQPDLLPGRRVQIRSREIDGFFRIEKSTFIGDTWGNDWYSDIEAKPL